MNRKITFNLILLILACFQSKVGAQNLVTVTDADLVGNLTYSWTNDNVYVLDGYVFLEEGAVLSIEAGTVIRALETPTTGDNSSALIITRGAEIYAQGTAQQPIIFTASVDDLLDDGDLTNEDVGLWGGVLILGEATVARPGGEGICDGFDITDPRIVYGGINDTDNSGVFSYVSIRHGGAQLNVGAESNGLTLAGVGNETQIDHVEVFAAQDDGFEFFGGTVNAYYLVATNCHDDAFDIDLGYRGIGQFWYGVQSFLPDPFDIGRLLEIDGARPDSLAPFAQPNLANLTLIGSTTFEDGDPFKGIFLRDNAGGIIRNSVIVNATDFGLVLEDRDDTVDGDVWARFQAGDLQFVNNVWNNEGISLSWDQFTTTVTSDDDPVPVSSAQLVSSLAQNNQLSSDFLIGSSCLDNAACLDPIPFQGSPLLTDGEPIVEVGFQTVDYQGAFGAGPSWLEGWTAIAGGQSRQLIHGRVTYNPIVDCEGSETAIGVPHASLTFVSEDQQRQVVTSPNGTYRVTVPIGTTEIILEAPNSTLSPCVEGPISVTLTENEDLELDLGLSEENLCAVPVIDISAPFLRRCFNSTYYVSYANQGTLTAEGLVAEVVLDDFLTYVSSSIAVSQQLGNRLIFELPALQAFETASFSIEVEVNCTSDLGQEHCTEATISSGTSCPEPLGAQLVASAECDGDSLRFEIENIGDATPLNPVPYIVVEDEVMLRNGDTQLPPGERLTFAIFAGEATMHLATFAFPDSSEMIMATATQSCMVNPSAPLNSYPLESSNPAMAIDCQANIGAFDPNDKYGSPAGVGENRIIPRDPSMSYRIRFQNTGTDTAFNIVIVDTLSPHFDLSTFQMGAHSHAMDWTLEDHVLRVSFPNIMLPDSNINEPLSHGFFNFNVATHEGLPLGTELNNKADIYFDFNEPIRTNETKHRIDELFDFVSSTRNLEYVQATSIISLFPQPASDQIRVSFIDEQERHGQFHILDQFGRTVLQRSFSGNGFNVELNELPKGAYTYLIFTQNGQLLTADVLIVQ